MSDDANEEMITCEICEEIVPASQSILRADRDRVCWYCYADEVDDTDWDDEDWDDDGDSYGSLDARLTDLYDDDDVDWYN